MRSASSLDELVRVTKQGGYITFTLRPDVYEQKGFREKQEQLVADGKWELAEVTDEFHGMPKGEPDVLFSSLGVQGQGIMRDTNTETTTDFDREDDRLRFSWEDLPAASAHLPGTGGVLRTNIEDFIVEEIPSYLPSGAGAHAYAFIEKREMTTQDCGVCASRTRACLAERWDSRDRRTSTRSLASGSACLPNTRPAFESLDDVYGMKVLETSLHRNKLGLGPLRGNRFSVRVRSPRSDWETVAESALAHLRQVGVPNYFGPQRFGSFNTKHRGRGCVSSRARGCVSTAGCNDSTSRRCNPICSTGC